MLLRPCRASTTSTRTHAGDVLLPVPTNEEPSPCVPAAITSFYQLLPHWEPLEQLVRIQEPPDMGRKEQPSPSESPLHGNQYGRSVFQQMRTLPAPAVCPRWHRVFLKASALGLLLLLVTVLGVQGECPACNHIHSIETTASLSRNPVCLSPRGIPGLCVGLGMTSQQSQCITQHGQEMQAMFL